MALKNIGAISDDATETVARLGTMRRQFAHVERYMDAYELGTMTLAQVEWCMKKSTPAIGESLTATSQMPST